MAFYVVLFLRELDIAVMFTISTGIGQFGMISLYIFIIKAFYPNRSAVGKVMMMVMVVLAVLTSSFAIARDVSWQDPGMKIALRLFHTIFATLQVSTSSMFQAIASLIGYRKFRKETVDRFVLFRFLLYGLSGFIMNATGWLDLVGTVFSVLGVAEYEVIMIIQIVLIFVFSIFTLIVWVMPRKVKDLINKSNKLGTTDGGAQVDEEKIMRDLARASGNEE
jgi:hypothetical protein